MQPPYGSPQNAQQTWTPGPTAPQGPTKKPSPLVVVGLIVGAVLAFGALIAFAGVMARRQAERCSAAMATANAAVAVPVDGSDDAAATRALNDAIEKCRKVNERAADVEALKASLARRQELGKSVRARPAMLAAGYKPEQLDRSAMVPVCRSRGLYVVEMVASNVAGEPHFWDCERNAVFGTMYLGPADCEARKLEHTTITDDKGNTVGACKRAEPEVETIPGLMRIKAEGVYVGATTKAKLERAVDIAASGDRAAFDRYVKTEPGVALMAPRTEVVLVDLDGLLLGPAKVRKRGETTEIWVLRDALESP